MADHKFEADYNFITPRLEAAVGRVVLEWTAIDHLITKDCELFWHEIFPKDRIPRPFDKRTKEFKSYAKKLYLELLNEPDEWITFAWYIQRLRDLNNRRDDIAHGFAGKITEGGKTYEGLMVTRPSHATRFVPQSTDDVARLGDELRAFRVEAIETGYAFYQAHSVSSPDKRAALALCGFPQPDPGNRSPKLPRRSVPPPTFRP